MRYEYRLTRMGGVVSVLMTLGDWGDKWLDNGQVRLPNTGMPAVKVPGLLSVAASAGIPCALRRSLPAPGQCSGTFCSLWPSRVAAPDEAALPAAAEFALLGSGQW